MDWQNAQYTVKNVRVFLYAVTMLIFQIKRVISSEKWLNYVFTFFENAKNLGRSDDAKRRKKEDGLIMTGKRDSRRRHYTTNFSENVLVAETSYQMLEVLPFCERETA